MPNLFCFGLGYSAENHVRDWGARFERVAATVRAAGRAAQTARDVIGGKDVDVAVFDGVDAPAAIVPMLREADCIIVSAPPDDAGDPVLRSFASALADAGRPSQIVYLSTVGVYGD